MGKKKEREANSNVRIFYEDLLIKQALLDKDRKTTIEFYYQGCYPLFRSLWERYETDCENPLELMNQVYLLMLYPSKETGKCQLENYRGESTLRSWIKAVALYYCFGVFDNQVITVKDIDEDCGSDTLKEKEATKRIKRVVSGESMDIGNKRYVEIDATNMINDEIMRLISLMPNKRYAEVIRLFKIEHCSNEEAADVLGIRVANMYNLHRRANDQFDSICRREGVYD